MSARQELTVIRHYRTNLRMEQYIGYSALPMFRHRPSAPNTQVYFYNMPKYCSAKIVPTIYDHCESKDKVQFMIIVICGKEIKEERG